MSGYKGYKERLDIIRTPLSSAAGAESTHLLRLKSGLEHKGPVILGQLVIETLDKHSSEMLMKKFGARQFKLKGGNFSVFAFLRTPFITRNPGRKQKRVLVGLLRFQE